MSTHTTLRRVGCVTLVTGVVAFGGCSSEGAKTRDTVTGALATSGLSAGAADVTTTAAWSALDLVWRNDGTGQRALWTMVGPQSVSSSFIAQEVADPAWHLESTGDFDGDGATDYAWRHYPDGADAIWLLDEEGSLRSSAIVDPVGDVNWRVVGAADINRDGRDDLIWRNDATAEAAVWYMNGTARAGSAFFQSVGSPWTLVGAGDVDGDGQPDLVWRSSAGDDVVWFMSVADGTKIDHSAYITSVGAPWRLDAVADLDRDGKTDLLWRNVTSGQNAVWFMNGATIEQGVFFTPVVGDPEWRIVGGRRRALHGMQVTARPDSPGYGRGVRTWLLQADFDASRDPTTLRLFGTDGTRPILFTQARVPDAGFYAGDISKSTYADLGNALDLRAVIDLRGNFVSQQAQDHFDLYASFAADAASPSTPRDGPQADGQWSNCDGPLLSVGLGVFELAGTMGLCGAIGVKLGPVCVAAWGLGPITGIGTCAWATGVTAAACSPIAKAACDLNSNGASLSCCVGKDQRKWPLPTSCPIIGSPTSATCECSTRLANSHTSSRAGLFGPEYRCALGSYKILTDYQDARTSVFAFGGWCRASTGSGSLTFSQNHGWDLVDDTGSWDDTPTITPGEEHVGSGVCDATSVNLPGLASGARNGQQVSESISYTPEVFTTWSSAYGEEGADHYTRKIDCQGWSDVDPVTKQVDPTSSFEACHARIAASLPKDGNGNPDFSQKPTAPDTCVSDACGPVGWH